MIEKISDHAKQKYLLRIKGLQLNESELKQYLAQNMKQIETEILKLFEFAILFYEGIMGKGTQKPSKFYINNDIILVVSRNGLDLITLYKVNFGYGSDDEGSIDKMVSRRLLNKIELLRGQRQLLYDNNRNKTIDIQSEADVIKTQIKNYESLVNTLKTQLKSKELELSTVNTNLAVLDVEIETKCQQLINYVEYQKNI